MRAVAVLLLAFLSGCANQSATGRLPTVTGDQRGGRIPNGMANVPAAMSAARAHCSGFARKAEITQMQAPSEGGLIAFECH
jgi:hypothetical protein